MEVDKRVQATQLYRFRTTVNVTFSWTKAELASQHLPAALLHLVGCDWLCPEAFAVLAPAARPTGLIAPGAPSPPLGARPHGQIQRGGGPPSVRATGVHTQQPKIKEKSRKER